MRIAAVLTPPSDHHLRLASQVGVTDITIRYPGPALADLIAEKERIEAFGLRVSIIEGGLPIENIKLGNEQQDAELEAMKQLIRNMGAAGVPVLCTNFMAGTDWVRTTLDEHERGGALVTSFDLQQASQAVSLDQSVSQISDQQVTAEQLWGNLERFLRELVPVAEEAGVVMAMHPDDPPLDQFMGKARILNCVEGFQRLVELNRSPSNGICFCQGTFAEMGVDIPAAIRRLGPHIRYVHFRDIRGTREKFRETFHDNGMTDMSAAMRAYHEIGFDGPIRPDHVPQLDGEEDGEPGYTMLGRLFAVGYIRGLLDSLA